MNEPLVSVIIPVYNVENFISDALESVCSQTYKNIEIICVDDGSKDNSLSILNFYSEKDNRIKIITQENSGVSGARNNGIRNAQGEYICFLDSDDFMHPQYIELQLKAIQNTGAEVAFCRFKNVPENSKPENFKSLKQNSFKISNNPLADFMFKREKIDSSSCNKLYLRSIVAENLFKLGVSRGEDEIFVLNILSKIKKAVANPQTLLFYRNRGGSLTKQNISETYLFDHYLAFITMSEILLRESSLKQTKLSEKQVKKYIAKKIYKRMVVHVLRKNNDVKTVKKLAIISTEYLNKLISAKVLDVRALPLSRRIMLALFQKQKLLSLVTMFCKI